VAPQRVDQHRGRHRTSGVEREPGQQPAYAQAAQRDARAVPLRLDGAEQPDQHGPSVPRHQPWHHVSLDVAPMWCHSDAMDLTPHVERLRHELGVAAAAGGEEAQALAERLTAPLESAVRLMLLEVLAEAADEITRELAPGSVEMR